MHAVAAQAVPDDARLPPGDVGGGVYRDRTSLVPVGDGACTMTVWPAGGGDPSGLAAQFEVTRVFNRASEARSRAAAQVGKATAVRGELSGRLIALGADPAAQGRARATVEAHARASARVRIDAEARLRLAALDARAGLGVYLQHCGGDPYRRQRDAAERARLAAYRLRVTLTIRAQLEARLIALGADVDFRQKRAAAGRRRARPPAPPPRSA